MISKIKYKFLKLLNKFSIEDYIGYLEEGYEDIKQELCYDYYKIFYKFKNNSYIAYTKYYIKPEELLYNILSGNRNTNIMYSYVKKGKNSIQVTNIINSISGPYNNFNNLYIDFKWVFNQYDELIIMYDDNILYIDINSNKIVNGFNNHIKLIT